MTQELPLPERATSPNRQGRRLSTYGRRLSTYNVATELYAGQNSIDVGILSYPG